MEFLGTYGSYIITSVVVIALLVIAYFVSNALGARIRGRRGQRLGISEYHEIDKTRRLVLIRRDDTEHLVMIGGHQDFVIESRISAGDGAAVNNNANDTSDDEEPGPRMPVRVAPRPAVFGDRAAPPLRAVPREAPRFRPATPSDP